MTGAQAKHVAMWPINRPWHLLVTAATLFTVMGMFAGHGGRRAPVAAGASPPPATTVPAATPPGGDQPAGTALAASTATTATTGPGQTGGPEEETAAAFVVAWADRTAPEPRWLAQLAPLATPDLIARLALVDPASVPVTAVTGQATGQGGQVTVPTDGGPVQVTVVESSAGWVVSDFTPS